MNFWGLFKIFLTVMSFFPKIDKFFLLAIFEKKWGKKITIFFLHFWGSIDGGKTLEPMLYYFTKKI